MPFTTWTHGIQGEDADGVQKRGGRQCIRSRTNFANGNVFHFMYRDGGAWRHSQPQSPFAIPFSDVLISTNYNDAGAMTLDFNDRPFVVLVDTNTIESYTTARILRYDEGVNNWATVQLPLTLDSDGNGCESIQILGDAQRDGRQYLFYAVQFDTAGVYEVRLLVNDTDWISSSTLISVQQRAEGVATQGPHQQRGAAACIDHLGDVHMVWCNREVTSDRFQIYYVKYTALTETLGTVELVEDTGPFSDLRYFTKELQITVDDVGTIHVVGINESQSTTRDVRYWRKSDVNWSAGENVESVGSGNDAFDVALGMSYDSVEGDFPYVLYTRADGGGATDLLVSERDASGTWTSSTLVNSGGASDVRANPQIPCTRRHLGGYIDQGAIGIYRTTEGTDRHRIIYTTDPVLSYANDQSLASTVEFTSPAADPLSVLSQVINHTVEFTETVGTSVVYLRELFQTVDFTASAVIPGTQYSFVIAHEIDLSHGANSILNDGSDPYQSTAPGFVAPPILACGAEDDVLFVHLIGPYPTLDFQIKLKRPDYSATASQELRVSTKRSRGGTIRQHVKGDTTEIISLPFSQLHRIKTEELKTFLQNIKGKQFYYLNEDGRAMQVHLISSRVTYRNEGREPAGSALIEIEGVFI